jgi:hypothetical protein
MKIAAAVVLSLGLTGCATAYKPYSFWNDGGFSETEVQPGLFQVRFKGNEFSSEERTADFAMLRASELCIGRGSKYMFLGDVATRVVQTGYVPGSATTTANASAYGYGNSAYASGSSHTTVTPPTALYSPQTGLTVACAKEKGDGAWDAEFLASSMRAKYNVAN